MQTFALRIRLLPVRRHPSIIRTMPFALDIVVLLAYFGLVFGIGFAQRRKSGSMEGFALGDRQIAWWAVLASILAAEISAGTFFGAPGEGFALRNYTYIQLIIGYLLARIVVSAVFIPAYYHHNVVSIYEFLGTRFGPRTRRVSSGVFLITRLLASGTRLWVPSMLLVLIWQLAHQGQKLAPTDEFLLTGGALLAVTFATAIYTTVGGIRAVIWTDVLQIIVLFCALGFSLWHLLGHIPGRWRPSSPASRTFPSPWPSLASASCFASITSRIPIRCCPWMPTESRSRTRRSHTLCSRRCLPACGALSLPACWPPPWDR
jgi:hypothetical protein